jgi:hypothetical protein
MANLSPLNRRFITLRGEVITGREAMKRYPDPAFFMRARPALSLDECREVLLRNCEEAARVVDMLRSTVASKSKAPIIGTANKLHDFRVSIDIFGGELGRPYLWEE